ncbi:hypothetical protein GDO78_014943 [Eleutherodactylus coqui]|uniref:Uncharacterized protein n=1 Tax=Eleutherodactylus coqui TaxID=57060 RepID=A0A8J6JPL5_ELECQ|nr:hypothetical protein GDO78_014943 [Eleutherodactylus coqui]
MCYQSAYTAMPTVCATSKQVMSGCKAICCRLSMEDDRLCTVRPNLLELLYIVGAVGMAMCLSLLRSTRFRLLHSR